MDGHAVELSHRATKEFLALPLEMRKRIAPRLDGLGDDPRPAAAVKLEGAKDAYRIRVGDYRVVYQIFEEQRQVVVARIGHRRDVYRNL